jgi:hypothetical protein
MPKLVDQYGRPIDRGALREPQTSRVTTLQNEYLSGQLDGLSPARVAGTLRARRRRRPLGAASSFCRTWKSATRTSTPRWASAGGPSSAWTGRSSRRATPAPPRRRNAEWLTEVLTDAADPFEELLVALMDGIGHGFAPVELEWRRRTASELLPAFHPRPQEWFRLDTSRREIRLRDASADGAPLQPFGWVLHTYGKAKTGYLGRMGLHRVLVWPFLYKAFAIGDFAEFLETFGLPMITGKYFAGATDDEKASLLRAVTALGHDARAIMPAEMAAGDPDVHHRQPCRARRTWRWSIGPSAASRRRSSARP